MKTEQLIRQEIERWGPMTFYRFIELALYHPQVGYYSRLGDPRGREGDYFTSFQVSSLFPRIMARALMAMRNRLDASEFSLVEFGSGGGEFLEGVITALQQQKELKGMKIFSVEKSLRARQQLKRRLSRFPKCHVIESLDDIDVVGGIEGCVFSNEFFDAHPFHRLRFTRSGWKEIAVTLDGGLLSECEVDVTRADLVPASDPAAWVEGQEIEVRPHIGSWYEALSGLFSRGYMLTFDYGYPRHQLYSPRRMKGTLMCYNRHIANTGVLQHIGRQDITAHIDFTQLQEEGLKYEFEPALFSSQGVFLTHIGSQEIQEFLNSASAIEKPRRMGAIQQLLHPDAMGETFWAFLQTKSAAVPSEFEAIPNRIKRLSPA